ncbi:hypothetical protein C8J57DRAFT_1520379 [Mycena rebaudengoi]|nr:hypothetical protein C8J57DRAFT_1520379 [Mycena rebaudengoi]
MSGAPPIDQAKLGEAFLLFTGPLLIGLILDWMLQGTLIVQLYLYYNANRKDSVFLKAVVYGIFLLDTIQTVFATAETWDMLVLNWGNPDIVVHPFWAVALCVQSFFAWRVYSLKPNRYVLGVSIMQCIASIVESAQFVADPTDLARIFPKHYMWLSGTLVADVLITASMVGVLWGVKRKTSHFESTDKMIMRLIVLSIEVGALTTIVAAAELAISNLYPQYFLYEVPAFILGKLSNNSLLVSLNARGYVRGDASTRVGTSSHSTGTAAQHAIPMKRAHGTYTSDTVDGNGTSAIHITTDTVTDNRYDRKGFGQDSRV